MGRTFKDHLPHLSKVLAQLRGAGLKLKPTKCSLCQQRVAFLGHIVSAEGIAKDPSKTDAVSKWPTPLSKKEVQQFLALANYYGRFVKNFASISKPLHRLTEKSGGHDCSQKECSAVSLPPNNFTVIKDVSSSQSW